MHKKIDVYDFDGTIYDGDSTVDFSWVLEVKISSRCRKRVTYCSFITIK